MSPVARLARRARRASRSSVATPALPDRDPRPRSEATIGLFPHPNAVEIANGDVEVVEACEQRDLVRGANGEEPGAVARSDLLYLEVDSHRSPGCGHVGEVGDFVLA